MLRGVGLLVALGLLTGLAEGQVPPAHTIKLKDAAVGDIIEVDEQTTEQGQVKVLDQAGKAVLDKGEYKVKSFNFKETVLEKPDGQKRPTRLRRQYTKAEVKIDGKPQALPYHGQSVLIEKKDGKYRFQIENGKELTGADAQYLENEFNKEKATDNDLRKMLLPGQPVRVGGTWPIDPTPLLKEITSGQEGAIGIDAAGAKATGKLLEVSTKDNQQWGKMEFLVDVPLKEFARGEQKLPLQPGARLTVTFAVDLCIDGSVQSGTIKGTVNMTASAALPLGKDVEGKLLLASRIVGQESRKELPRK